MAANDDSFGPFYHIPGQYNFDFTLFFEETILTIIPSAFLLVATPPRFVQLWRSSRKVKASRLRTSKMALLFAFAALQTVNLILWVLEPSRQTSASVAAAVLQVVVAISLLGLSNIEHSRSIHPSFLINSYLLVTTILDAAKVRTLWLRAGTVTLSGIASVSLAFKLCVLLAEAIEKRKILLLPHTHHSPESTSSLYARLVFWWLNPLFLSGFQNVLQERDLFDIEEALSAKSLSKRFHAKWNSCVKPSKRHRLLSNVAACMSIPLTAAVFPRLCQTFFRFMQPLLIKKVTLFVELADSEGIINQGWGLTAAYGLVYVGIAISVAMYNYQAYRVAAMIRGALVTAIYSKTLSLSITTQDEAAAITLMSTDVQRLSDAMPFVHELWACPLEIGLAIWLLENELGLALLGPVFVLILAVSLISAVASRMASAQKSWLAAIQTRVSVTARSLQATKSIKMLGLTPVVIRIIEDLRSLEIRLSLRSRYLMAYSIMCGNLTDIFAPGSAFAIYVIMSHYDGRTLTPSSAYTIMSLIALLANPTKVLINFAIPQISVAVGCFDRIQDYLLSESRRDDRLVTSEPNQEDDPYKAGYNSTRGETIKMKTFSAGALHAAAASNRVPTVRAIDCTLVWRDGEQPVVHGVSFELFCGLTMIVGKVGCGKTSLIKGILGELQSRKGHIFVATREIAFVDQSPWLYQGTIRENIIGASVFNQEYYSQVVHACALEDDIRAFAQGDNTQIGSDGSKLSGGQRLRVALARAVYSRKQILVLDDTFSGIDRDSEERIFTRLFGKEGILKLPGITTILSSHAANRLIYADHIIALDDTGTVAEQGSFPQLVAEGKYVSRLVTQHTTEKSSKAECQLEAKLPVESDDAERAVAEDDLFRPVGDRAVYKYYFTTTGRWYAVVFFLTVALFAFLVQFPALWLTFWTNAVASYGNEVNGDYLGGLIAFNVAAMASLTCVVYLAYTRMVPRSAIRLHERLLQSVKYAPLSFFTSTGTGKILNRFSQDMNIVDFELPWALVEFAAAVCLALIQAVFICLSAAYFAAIMPLVLGIMYLLQKFYLRTSRQVRLIDLEAKSPLYSNFIETLNGLLTIRAFDWIAEFEDRNQKLLDRSQRPLYGFFCIQRWLNLVLDLTVAGLAVVLMVLIVVLREKLQAGLVGVALLNIMNFNLSLTEVIKQWTTLETSLGAVARVKNFVDETPCETMMKEDQEPPASWPEHGEIVLRDVTTAYVAEGVDVLHGINLNISSGQKIGIVGHSGSGKSSLVSTLLHLLWVRSGTVIIDGQMMQETKREQWRRGLNVIPQEPVFVYGSIRANLNPFSENIAGDHFTRVLQKVGLQEIVSQVGGLDIELDAEKMFSHGQRQLFCLARAILNQSHSKILILDEATASVDVQTDEIMQRLIREEFKGFTILAVAHRLQTIIDFDRIVVLDKGRIVEDGNPQTLLAQHRGYFRKLWNSS